MFTWKILVEKCGHKTFLQMQMLPTLCGKDLKLLCETKGISIEEWVQVWIWAKSCPTPRKLSYLFFCAPSLPITHSSSATQNHLQLPSLPRLFAPLPLCSRPSLCLSSWPLISLRESSFSFKTQGAPPPWSFPDLPPTSLPHTQELITASFVLPLLEMSKCPPSHLKLCIMAWPVCFYSLKYKFTESRNMHF